MKKGKSLIFFGTLLIFEQIFFVSGFYTDLMGGDIYTVSYNILGFTLEFIMDKAWLYYSMNYIIGVLGTVLLLIGLHRYSKSSYQASATNRFTDSYYALKDTRTLVQCAVLVALYVVLDMLQIKLPFLEFTFAFVALAGIAYIAGPVTGFFCGGICEILGYLMAPKTGPLHLGITFTAMLTGFVMGAFLYKREIKIVNIIIARSIVAVIFNLGLNTYWISTLIGKAYLAMLPARAIKTFVELPVDIFLIFLVLKLVLRINKGQNTKKKENAKASR